MPEKPAIIIYRNHLLYPSETFIKAQAEALKNFVPYYTGLRRVKGIDLPENRIILANRTGKYGKLRDVFYRLLGFPKHFLRKLSQLNPVLLHAHFGLDGVTARTLARRMNIPLIVTFHGFDATTKDKSAWHYGHRIYIFNKKKLMQETRLFLAVSNFIKTRLLEQGFPPERILTHYIGVDTEWLRQDPALKRQPVVLFVGRLVEKKGCEYLIKAMSKVQKMVPEVKLIVIGDGALRSSLERIAAESLRHYRFMGVQPPDQVKFWMNQATVFSVPSITAKSGDAEGFGTVFAEAQAMGLPAVSFVSGGIPEVVAHQETGFLVAERDWEGLAEHIKLLIEDKDLWNRFSAAGQDRVRQLFDLKKQTTELENIYRKALNE